MKRKNLILIGVAAAVACALGITACAQAANNVRKNPQAATRGESLTATMEYTTSTTTNMTPTGNAATVGLDSNLFAVNADKGETSNFPGLNKAHDIRLYSLKSANATGHGSSFTVSISGGYLIDSIEIDFKQNGDEAVIYAGSSVVEGEDNVYSIDASSFKVENGYKSTGDANPQVHINKITITYEEASIPATNISLNESSLDLDTGDEVTLVATLTPSNSTDEVTWLSSNTGVATVEDSGLVKAVGAGNTVITAFVDADEDNVVDASELKAQCTVSVTYVHGTLESDPLTAAEAIAIGNQLNSGDTTEKLYYISGTVSKIVQNDLSGSNNYATFWLSNGNTVEGFEGYRVKPISTCTNYSDFVVGAEVLLKCTIKKYNSTIENGYDANILSIYYDAMALTGILLNETELSLVEEDYAALTVSPLPDGAVIDSVSWHSDDETVATVDANGIVTAVGAGDTTISATVGSFTETCDVTVTSKNLNPGQSASLDFSIENYAKANSVASGTKVSSIVARSLVTFDAVGEDTNTGKIYIGDSYTEWRFYGSGSGTLKISVPSGYSLVSAKGQIGTANFGTPTEVVFTIANNQVEYNPGANFNVKSLTVVYKANDVVEPTAEETINEMPSRATLSYKYTKEIIDAASDTLTKSFAGYTGTGYTAWSKQAENSGVVYAGNTAGGTNANPSLQFKSANSNAGIVTTSSSGKVVSISIVWNSATTDTRYIDVYGKNEPYSAVTDLYSASEQGDLLGSFSYIKDDTDSNVLTIDVEGSYSYIGFRSRSNASYVDQIVVDWTDVSSFTYSNVAIRFGGFLSEDLWYALNDEAPILGYGVKLLAAPGELSPIDYYYELDEERLHPAQASAAQKAQQGIENPDDATDIYYVWNLYVNVFDNLAYNYSAVAYIRTTDGDVLFAQTTTSAAKLADELIKSGAYASNAFDGSLNDLANKQ